MNEEEMSWQDKYLSPSIEREKFKFSKLKRMFFDFKEIFMHAISFHKRPQYPPNELPDFESQDTEIIYMTCKQFYDDANNRIDNLEDKSLKLLSYITALFAFISFAFINTNSIGTKILLLASIIFLILSIIISFRCVNVKGRQSLFLPSVYDFSNNNASDNFDKRVIAKKMLNSAIFNQNVADNTADILKAARYTLTIAITVCIIGFLVGINGYFSDTGPKEIKIDNPINLNKIEETLDKNNLLLEKITDNIKNLDNKDNLYLEIQQLNNELENLKTDFKEVLKSLEELKVKENTY